MQNPNYKKKAKAKNKKDDKNGIAHFWNVSQTGNKNALNRVLKLHLNWKLQNNLFVWTDK